MRSDQREEDLSTADTLRLFADIMEEGKVLVQLTPQFLREVADEIDALHP